MKVTQAFPKFYVSVDCIVFGFAERRLKVLLFERHQESGKSELSLIGDFVQNDESVDSSAQRILKEFTGLDNIYMQQLATNDVVERDSDERFIHIVYYALMDVENYNPNLSDIHHTQWIDVDNIPNLRAGQNEMVQKARCAVGKNIKNEPVGSYLLPQYFTLSMLQTLYESILDTTMDKRNFRRFILEKDFVQATDMMDHSSRRGASLYRFKILNSLSHT